MKNKTKYGLALSGGGARGIAHIGVLKALEENGIVPSVLSGTSMGTLVAVAYGLGIGYDEMLRFITKEARPLRVRDMNLKKMGLFDLERVRKVFEERAPKDDFSVLKVPVFITVTNLNKGTYEIKSEGKFIDYAIASASIPVLFTPAKIGDNYYVDGGLTKNMAARVLQPYCDKVIGVHVNHIGEINEFRRMKDIASRAYHLAVYNTILEELDSCDYLLDPPATRQFKTLDFQKAEEIFEVGYFEGLKLADLLNSHQTLLKQTISRLRKSILERIH